MLDGSLFTRDFLAEGIMQEADWKHFSDADAKAMAGKIEAIFTKFPLSKKPNESQTEDDVVWPILAALGWSDHLRQQNLSARGRDDVPDGLLFPDADAKARANHDYEEWRRYEHGLAIVESKRWNRLLDRPDRGKEDKGVPSTQIIRYLRRVDDLTTGKLRWGILTNGRIWRLYYQGARSVSEDFLELDLASILGIAPYADLLAPKNETERLHWFKIFALMFRRDAFLPGATDPRPFHLRALEQGHFWEEKVARDLSELVFERVFPDLARGLAGNDPDAPSILSAKYLEEVRNGALILLYRLLFVLYAEDRNLLPVSDRRYEDYGLRAKVREDVHARIDKGDAFSSTAGNYYGHMKGLFRAIAKGDAALGLPPYNGGLFEPSAAPILVRAELPDSVIAPVIHALSRRKEEGRKVYINYRDLSVQQLGSIYERLLEFQLRADGGAIIVWPNVFARRGSGSYYTPDELVSLIINRTIGPLIDERLRAFERQANRLARASHSIAARLQDLAKFDPASAILDLKICDPAMGSGHFLVSLVDYLADRILATIAESESKEAVEWGDYVSPLGARILAIRSQIEKHAEEEKWVIEDGQLDDRHILRRMILKRVIHGVDKNPMAVELAKVALWLHTFTVGAPLSFLDHHLKCGDSLFGEWVRPVMDKIVKWGGELLINNALQRAQGKDHFFPDVDSRFKFCALIAGGKNRKVESASCAFFLHGVEDILGEGRAFPMSAADFAAVNPNTGTAPIFRSRHDADLTKVIYARVPVLVNRSGDAPVATWPVKYSGMFHMTNDSGHFKSAADLKKLGAYPVAGGRWKKGKDEFVPLYEGKMVQAYDHRAASVTVNPANLNRPAQPLPATHEQHADTSWLPTPQFWIAESVSLWPSHQSWLIDFKDVTAPTNVRTMIAAAIPASGVGNTLPVIMPENDDTTWYRSNGQRL